MQRTLLFPIVAVIFLAGCSIQTIALRSTGALVDYGLEAINEESDLPLAEQSIASNLKLLEGLLKGDPENAHLLLLASRGYSSFALGFAEDDSPERGRVFYLRARDYGLRILTQRNGFAQAWDKDLDSFQQALSALNADDVPAIFWTANGWGNYIRLTLTEPAAIADLPKVEALLRFVLEKDETYFFASAHLAMGTLLGSRPKLLGGNPEKAREHFERCLEITTGKFLMAYVYYAMAYAVQTQNKELFSSLLHKVDDASLDVLPEQRLANSIAKKKAEKLMAKLSDLFE
ncbi:MAG: TRAP transporter TatT component family protein [Bacteroidota bacterium]